MRDSESQAVALLLARWLWASVSGVVVVAKKKIFVSENAEAIIFVNGVSNNHKKKHVQKNGGKKSFPRNAMPSSFVLSFCKERDAEFVLVVIYPAVVQFSSSCAPTIPYPPWRGMVWLRRR